MYKVTTNSTAFQVSLEDKKVTCNNEKIEWDLSSIDSGSILSCIYKNQSFNIEVVKSDFANKSFVLKVNGKLYASQLESELDLLLKKLGFSNTKNDTVSEIKAPMPGMVVEVLSNEGQDVKKGDKLLILEAMKMENIIKSPRDGIIQSIKVQAKDNVEKNQLLISFE